MNRPKTQERDYSDLLIKLLQGFVYREDQRYWDQLMLRQEAVRAYFETLKLQLYVDDADGYAFLRSFTADEGDETQSEEVPEDASMDSGRESTGLRLMRKVPLTFEVSLLCVLLREALEQFDEKVSDDHRLILSRPDIHDLLREFFVDTTDESKLRKRFDSLINKAEELGFLRSLRSDEHRFEVRRSIKALIDAQKLGEIKRSMHDFVALRTNHEPSSLGEST